MNFCESEKVSETEKVSGRGIYGDCPEFTTGLEWRHNWIFLLTCDSNKNFVREQKEKTYVKQMSPL